MPHPRVSLRTPRARHTDVARGVGKSEERALAADLLARVNAGESVTLDDEPVDPPALYAILAVVTREMAEIFRGRLEGRRGIVGKEGMLPEFVTFGVWWE